MFRASSLKASSAVPMRLPHLPGGGFLRWPPVMASGSESASGASRSASGESGKSPEKANSRSQPKKYASSNNGPPRDGVENLPQKDQCLPQGNFRSAGGTSAGGSSAADASVADASVGGGKTRIREIRYFHVRIPPIHSSIRTPVRIGFHRLNRSGARRRTTVRVRAIHRVRSVGVRRSRNQERCREKAREAHSLHVALHFVGHFGFLQSRVVKPSP